MPCFVSKMKKKTWIFWPAFDTACDHSEGWARVTKFKGHSSDDGLSLHTCNKEKAHTFCPPIPKTDLYMLKYQRPGRGVYRSQ